MLSDEHRVTTHRSLFPVIVRMCHCQALFNKVGGMPIDCLRPFIPTVLTLLLAKTKTRTKGRTGKTDKEIVSGSHQ